MVVDKPNIESCEQSEADWLIDSFCVIINENKISSS